MSREVMQQALEALEFLSLDFFMLDPISPGREESNKAITALRTALAQQPEPVEPVAWMVYTEGGTAAYVTDNPNDLVGAYRALPLYTAPPQRLPLTDKEILLAAGWERAEMWMKLAPNFPVDEARKETIKNARAVEKAVWEKNHE